MGTGHRGATTRSTTVTTGPLRVALVAATLVVATLVAVESPARATAACPTVAGLSANVWQGAGVGPGAADTETDTNWSLGVSPIDQAAADRYVCIPSGGTPVMTDGQEISVQVLVLLAGSTLTLAEGSEMFLRADQTTRASTVQAGADLVVDRATFGGEGRLDLAGDLTWHGVPGAAASITTRECVVDIGDPSDDAEPCPASPLTGQIGLIEVAGSGRIWVTGGGVNLRDQYRIDLAGRLTVVGSGYVAADRGTSLQIAPGGELRFAGDGGWYEGFAGPPGAALSTVVNNGLVRKTAGSSTSMVTATYSQPSGGVRVDDGTLLLPRGASAAARVGRGDSYGTGLCPPAASYDSGCEVSTFGAHTQSAQLRVPSIDANGAKVQVNELSARPGDLGRQMLVHADGLKATPRRPAVIELRLDERILNGKTWTAVKVFRSPGGPGGYRRVPWCRGPDQRPPAGQRACVVRSGPDRSHNVVDAEGPGGADVVMVIHTTGTSRWVAR